MQLACWPVRFLRGGFGWTKNELAVGLNVAMLDFMACSVWVLIPDDQAAKAGDDGQRGGKIEEAGRAAACRREHDDEPCAGDDRCQADGQTPPWSLTTTAF